MKTIATTLFLFLFAVPLWAADSYLCIAEQLVGFIFNEPTKKWEGVAKKNSVKYIVKKDIQLMVMYSVI